MIIAVFLPLLALDGGHSMSCRHFWMSLLLTGVVAWVRPVDEQLFSADAAIGSPPKELGPRTFTLRADNLALADVLKELTKQTGITVADRRQAKDDRRLNRAFTNVPFWEAVDQIAAATGSSISLYQEDRAIALVDGPYVKLPISYSGLFRTVVKRITLVRDLEINAHVCHVKLEVAWEPRFQPFLLESKDVIVRYGQDKTGALREFKQAGKGKDSVTGRTVAEIDVQVPAADRSVANIKTLEGSFAVVGPTKMLTFTFDNLKAVPTEKVQDGISATLAEFTPDEDHWTVKVALKYPSGGPRFESYQASSWLGNNKIYLENGKQRWLPSGENSSKVTSNEAVIEYFFDNPGGRKAADWRLVCVTAGRIVELNVPFRFKELLLP
jgi:hypothetical protein